MILRLTLVTVVALAGLVMAVQAVADVTRGHHYVSPGVQRYAVESQLPLPPGTYWYNGRDQFGPGFSMRDRGNWPGRRVSPRSWPSRSRLFRPNRPAQWPQWALPEGYADPWVTESYPWDPYVWR